MKYGSYAIGAWGVRIDPTSGVSFPTSIRAVLMYVSGRMNVTAVVVRSTNRNTARITVLRMRIIRQ
jgi:hypothetical protein